MSNDEVTTKDIMDFLRENMVTREEFNELSVSVDKRFDAVDKRFDAVDTRFEAVDKRFEQIECKFAGLKYELLDAMDRKYFDLKGDLTLLLKQGNTQVIELVGVLQKKDVINENEAKKILSLAPFSR